MAILWFLSFLCSKKRLNVKTEVKSTLTGRRRRGCTEAGSARGVARTGVNLREAWETRPSLHDE